MRQCSALMVTTGEIAFITTPNFEVPGDSDNDNEYLLTLTATEDGEQGLPQQ